MRVWVKPFFIGQNMRDLSLDDLKSYLQYDPETGVFTWLKKIGRSKRGKVAGTPMLNGYISIGICGNKFLAHRLAWHMHFGRMPSGQIDHINHDRQDNRIANLREVSNQENARNSSLSRRSSTGVIGVSRNSNNGYFEAHVTVDGKKRHLGWFKRVEDAAKARQDADEAYGFHRLHGQSLSLYPKSANVPREIDPRQLNINTERQQ